jgi:hypothetical protein
MACVSPNDRVRPPIDVTTLSDPDLVCAVSERAAGERQATAELIRVLIEFDRRRLYLAEGYPSLYAYCTQALHYSEHGAFNRIEVARAAARWPQLLARIEDGSLHLSGARLIAPHLTEENIEAALASVSHKSKREIEEVAAAIARRNVLVAVAAEQYRLHLTISRQARDTLRQVQALLGHQVPGGNEAVIFERALALLLEKLQQERAAITDRPRPARRSNPRSRYIPAAVRREVWKRDEGRCAFVGNQGRCNERSRVEYHHVVPYAAGGAKTAANIELRCRAHNSYEAETYFGAEKVAAAREHRRSGGANSSVRGGRSATPDGASTLTRPGATSNRTSGPRASKGRLTDGRRVERPDAPPVPRATAGSKETGRSRRRNLQGGSGRKVRSGRSQSVARGRDRGPRRR